MDLRREFDLPPDDVAFLDGYNRPWETMVDGSQWVLIHDFNTQHDGYNSAAVTVAIRIETGYPLAALDMVYVHPHMARRDGQPIGRTEALQPIHGVEYQRWSRHYTPNNPWITGVDGLERHVLSIEEWFRREIPQCA